MKIRRIIPFVLAIVMLVGSVYAVSMGNNAKDSPSTPSQIKKDEEMRGVWVTYMTLDVENESEKETAFKNKVDQIIKEVRESGFNTLVVQVRPFSDALYRSSIYPWSHIITGEQGKDPGFDPLKYICDNCHNNNLQIHAWVNPYRVKTANTPNKLSNANPYVIDSSIGFEVNDAIYLNPTSEKARKIITDGVREIVENYEVDGVQFDDYFYPEDCGDFDKEEYEVYKSTTTSPVSLEEWRMNNVSELINDVYKTIHDNSDAVFGISPQGNLANNKGLYADVERWCKDKGYIDYICPQIYFSLDNPALTFEDSLNDWLNLSKHNGLQLFVGLAGYKAGSSDADSGTWADNTDILRTEIDVLRQKKADGFVLYSYDSFHSEESTEEIENVISYLISSPTQ